MPETHSNNVVPTAEKSNISSNHKELETNEVFVDTNILIYANLTASPFHKYAKSILEMLNEITTQAMHLLCKEMGTVNTIRFINQFTVGYFDNTKERELFT
jgi:hypothetical protein